MASWLLRTRGLLRRWWGWCGILVLGLLGGAAGYGYFSHREATRHWEQAERALDAQDLPAAGDHLRRYLADRPASAQGRFLLAQTLRRDSQLDEAEPQLGEARRLGWDAKAVGREQFLAWLQRQGVRESSNDHLLALAQSADADRPLLEALYRGDRAARNWDRAGLWLHLWLERYPDDWPPRLWQAELLRQFEKYDRARADYLRVLALRTEQPQALLGVGLCALANRADYAEGEAYLRRYLEGDPGHLEANLGLATCSYGRGDLAGARQRLLNILAGNPRHAGAALLLGMVEAEAARDEEALRWLRLAETEGAEAKMVHYQLAQVLQRLGHAAEAEAHQRRFQELRAARWALESAVRAADREPHNADRLYEAGRLSLAAGEGEQAVMWFRKALQQDPAHRPSHTALADYYARQTDPEAAARALFHRRKAQGE